MNFPMSSNESHHFESFPVTPFSSVLYAISKAEIVAQNPLRFAEFFNIERIVKAGRLHDMFGRVVFCVDGYNDDGRELFQIQEVREFLRIYMP